MSMLLSKRTAATGHVQHITPQNAGWDFVGFDVWHLKAGEVVTLLADKLERCLVLVSGIASVKTADHHYQQIGQRMSPFEKIPAWSVYLPHHTAARVTAETDLELAVCSAPGQGDLPVRLIAPEDVGVEHRGKGRNQRLVHNILPDDKPADSLLVVEVYTNEGDTSSWPAHKHDTHKEGQETYLEETYYHRFNPAQGFCLQRVYTDDRSLDECMAVYDGDVVKVPRGYHPVATIAGYDNYYLNVMAGPVRKWQFTWEKDHAWINTPEYPR
ncbi:5-deoxyglucuronate isomerase [Mangrovibacter sp. MFB070]|uniref:5-deoxy-glucuronate isomerase n=1 Tax=Mangrovibacter sp. MFB070 TaxID=1224318 RepID=UPI0004DAD289|nr:5-deoxy-glucuronate isomerase [Mangrovibacter sp. MFB070]KEA53671.1 5-deoxyglucuronate isomerase [Mangrovibacter sp. MFB070]